MSPVSESDYNLSSRHSSATQLTHEQLSPEQSQLDQLSLLSPQQSQLSHYQLSRQHSALSLGSLHSNPLSPYHSNPLSPASELSSPDLGLSRPRRPPSNHSPLSDSSQDGVYQSSSPVQSETGVNLVDRPDQAIGTSGPGKQPHAGNWSQNSHVYLADREGKTTGYYHSDEAQLEEHNPDGRVTTSSRAGCTAPKRPHHAEGFCLGRTHSPQQISSDWPRWSKANMTKNKHNNRNIKSCSVSRSL
eukprot:g38048.t1